VALPALATAAGCIGNSRALLLKRGWVEPCVVWALVVGESGSLKTPAFNAAVQPLVELQVDAADEYEAEAEKYREELAAWKDAPKESRGARPAEPDPPATYTTRDSTIEALGELLRDAPRGLLLARDELDAWFGSFSRYKGKGGGSDRPQWLELHGAGTLIIDRLTRARGRLAVRRAAVSLCGSIQPAVLARALDDEAMSAGLGARFLLAMPPRRRRRWSEAELPDELVTRYTNLLIHLLGLPLADERKRKPHVLGMSDPARQIYLSWFDEWAGEQFRAEGEQAAAFAKLEAYAPRLITLHHVVSCAAADADDRRPVGEVSVRAGIELTRWFAGEVSRVYSLLKESADERRVRVLVEWIAGHGGKATVRALQKSNARKWPQASDAEAALEELVQGGWARGGTDRSPTAAGAARASSCFHLRRQTLQTLDPTGETGGAANRQTLAQTLARTRACNRTVITAQLLTLQIVTPFSS
jgi:hypothetical protein